MGKLRVYLDRINQAYPDIGVQRAQFVESGQNNDVLIVNDSLVFRFPRHQAAMKRLSTECAILNCIRPYITSVEVPVPLFTNLSPSVGDAFMGYRIIEGETGTLKEFQGNSNTHLAFQLGTFLRELHSIPAIIAKDIDIPMSDQRECWDEMYLDARRLLFPHMSEDAKKGVEANFESFLEDRSNFELLSSLTSRGCGAFSTDPRERILEDQRGH